MPRTFPGRSSRVRDNGLTRTGLLRGKEPLFFGIHAKRLRPGNSAVALNRSSPKRTAYDHLLCRHTVNLLLLAGVDYFICAIIARFLAVVNATSFNFITIPKAGFNQIALQLAPTSKSYHKLMLVLYKNRGKYSDSEKLKNENEGIYILVRILRV